MQTSISILTKQAISAALKQNWAEAIELNQAIIDKSPQDIEAKNRLGRAYIQLKEFSKAKKLFEDVLKLDPINNVALKNLEVAKSKKFDTVIIPSNTNSFLKEPGTSEQLKIESSIDATKYSPIEPLILNIKKKSIDVVIKGKVVGTIIKEDIVSRVNSAIFQKGKVTAEFLKGKGKDVTIVLKSTVPVFKVDKLDVRPDIKKGSFEEPELEIENMDSPITE